MMNAPHQLRLNREKSRMQSVTWWMRTVSSTFLMSVSLCALGACEGGPVVLPAVGSPCGVGERGVIEEGAFQCVAAPYLSINVDERVDESVDVRRGIGANGCIYKSSDLEAVQEVDDCAVFSYEGQSAIDSRPASTGGIAINLDDPVLLSKAPEEDCFGSNLDRERSDLFSEGQEFVVEGLGGGDLEPFVSSLVGPSELTIEAPVSRSIGEDIVVTWANDVEHHGDRILIALRASNSDDDTASHVVCAIADEEGQVRIDGELTRHLVEDNAWQLFALRQNWVHLEPAGTELAVDLFATTSVVRSIAVVDEE